MSRSGVARVDFYFDDWLTGTFELDPEQRGTFITICALIWKTGDRLADNDDAVARWIGVRPRRWRELKAMLVAAGKIALEDGFIRQPRAAQELTRATDRYHLAQRRGQKTAQKYAHISILQNANPLEINDTTSSSTQSTNTNIRKKEKEEPPNPLVNGADHIGKPEPSPPPAAASVKPAKSARLPDELPEPFLRLWNAYPVRQQDRNAKLDVFKRWKADTEGQDHEAIIAAAKAYACTNGRDDFRLGLKTWLRNRTWLEPQSVSNGNSTYRGSAYDPEIPF